MAAYIHDHAVITRKVRHVVTGGVMIVWDSPATNGARNSRIVVECAWPGGKPVTYAHTAKRAIAKTYADIDVAIERENVVDML